MAETVKIEPGLCQVTDLPNKKRGLNRTKKKKEDIKGGDKEALVYISKK